MLTFKRLGYRTIVTAFCFLLLLQAKESRSQEHENIRSSPPVLLSLKDTCNTPEISAANGSQVTSKIEIPEEPKIELAAQAEIFVAEYLKKNDADLQKIKSRSKSYFKTIDAVFTKSGLPIAVKYLAVIESELKTSAVSHAGAAGLWQLMPQTARFLGLRVTASTDERKTVLKSTQAAAKYIKALYAQFDDWLLVVAAYNSGAGPVYKAIKKAGSRDFWRLQRFLPAETRNHVKRYIGAHYFFEGEGSATTLTRYETEKHAQKLAEYNQRLQVISQMQQTALSGDEVLQKPKAAGF